MLKAILDLNVASVRRRISQGDCPTEPALSVEMLENMVSDLAAMREGVDRGMVERLRAALKPFVGYISKDGASITLTWGNDKWTGTLTSEDFRQARETYRAALDTDQPR